MIPTSRSKVEKMKALQSAPGPWSRDSSGSRQKKVLAMQQQNLQQQKGPWSRQEGSLSHAKPSQLSTDFGRSGVAGPRHSHRRSPNTQNSADSNSWDIDVGVLQNKHNANNNKSKSMGSSKPPPPPPPPPPKPTPNTLVTRTTSRLDTPQHMMCFCTAITLFKKQWAVFSYSNISRYFHMWRRKIVPTMKSPPPWLERSQSSKDGEKTKTSILLWLSSNSRMKNLRSAWKKWMFAVVASQCQDKNAAIETLSAALNKENEQYKLKLTDIMEKVRERDNLHRHTVVNTTMINYIRIKAKIALKRWFDTWSRVTWQMSYDQTLKREKYKMEIGFQAISSEQVVKEESRIHSSKLQSTLLCLVAFSSWKLKMKEHQFGESRKQWAEEKQVIQDNLLSLQKSLLSLNNTERDMVNTARSRGMDMFSSLYSVSDKLERCSSSRGTAPSLHGGHSSSRGHSHSHGGGLGQGHHGQKSSSSSSSGGGILKKKKKKLLFEEVIK